MPKNTKISTYNLRLSFFVKLANFYYYISKAIPDPST